MSIYQEYKPAGGGDGLYLKLKDGDSVKLRVASEPAVYTQTFDDNITTRFAWVVWNRGEKKAQVFSGGKSIFNQFAELTEEWGEPTEFDVTIKRTGEMLETRYSVTPLPKSEDLTKAEQAECDKVDLIAAVKGHWLKDWMEQENEPAPTDEDAPIDLDAIDFGEN